MSRICSALIVVLLALGTACQPGDTGLPEMSEHEREALAAFHAWTEHCTSARKDQKFETRDDHGRVSGQETTGRLDYRARTGRTTGTYTYRDADDTTRTTQTETVLDGDDEYVLYHPAASPKPWRITDTTGWALWTDYERALTHVRAEGTTTVQGRPAGKFTGLVDMFSKRTIARLPDSDCAASTLAIDLYLDEGTGTMLRYDLRPVRTTYTDFGVPVPAPEIPDPAAVQPRPDLKPGAVITLEAEYTVPPGCRPSGPAPRQ